MTRRTFHALGQPAPQGSKTAVVRGGRAIVIEGSSTTGRKRHKAWRVAVAEAAKACVDQAGPLPPKTPLSAVLHFTLPKPQSKAKYLRWVTVKPDLDKLLRSTLDGLADGGLFDHDQRVASIVATKRYALPGQPLGCRVDVTELDHKEAQ